jgi:CheY-like chemotaxis protein
MSSPAHILIVDDSHASRARTAEILEAEGYHVSLASSAEEAIPMFKGEEFDLVITEVILPGMSGLNMLKLFKEIRPETDVVVVSSNTSSFTTIKALRLGAYDYIVKPVDDESVLYSMVDRVLEKQELARENQRLMIEIAEKNRKLSESLKMMKMINQVCVLLTSTLDIASILRILTESAVKQLHAANGYLMLLDKSGSFLTMKVSSGIDHNLSGKFKLAPGNGISGLVFATGKPLIIDTADSDEYTARFLEEDPDGGLLNAPGILSVPLQVQGKTAGILTVSGGSNGVAFTEEQFEFLSILSSYAAIAIENAGVFYKLKKQL